MKAAAYHHLYGTSRWQRIRARQLHTEPLCALCTAIGQITEASICDHVTPHKGDPIAFHAGPFQSLCKPCHDGAKAEQERTGRMRGCDVAGFPEHWRT